MAEVGTLIPTRGRKPKGNSFVTIILLSKIFLGLCYPFDWAIKIVRTVKAKRACCLVRTVKQSVHAVTLLQQQSFVTISCAINGVLMLSETMIMIHIA